MLATQPVTSFPASTEGRSTTIGCGLIAPPAPGPNSKAKIETTANISSGLVIIPTFDDTITNDPRSDAIQAMIISAIDVIQTLFSDPITVSIRFRFSGFQLGRHPHGLPGRGSNSGIHQLDWDPYIAALKADGYDRERYERECDAANERAFTNYAVSQCQWSGSWAGHAPCHVCRWQSRRGRPV